MSNMKKTAVDATAKKYWESFYKEYGRAWVRDIPRKIKAAIDPSNSKSASVNADAPVLPIAMVRDGSDFLVEGIYKGHSGSLLFKASFTTDGDIKGDVDYVEL